MWYFFFIEQPRSSSSEVPLSASPTFFFHVVCAIESIQDNLLSTTFVTCHSQQYSNMRTHTFCLVFCNLFLPAIFITSNGCCVAYAHPVYTVRCLALWSERDWCPTSSPVPLLCAFTLFMFFWTSLTLVMSIFLISALRQDAI